MTTFVLQVTISSAPSKNAYFFCGFCVFFAANPLSFLVIRSLPLNSSPFFRFRFRKGTSTARRYSACRIKNRCDTELPSTALVSERLKRPSAVKVLVATLIH